MKNEFDTLKQNFDENGFVIVENLLDEATLENLPSGWKKLRTM